ncbi:MAG: hypothetical protein ACD_66C00099G0003 [uncultured bacterium]|uniref:Uncharacterized protein n=1 Tax=Candidatus Uhrbacteria bacterium GW2011_GWC1_41_20 TaxID=1618983 RepID=A0A0G0VER4_9BACT|nr:MAG: hypothetical protein ACD_66C00099G0003 [uncultured bacterium]KKR22711.1 MAG: hypothetical protein UT52_C0008G0011 [Candidatus Uhrbacteria bacterium GW2011_GWE1_39_46]KKR64064.1 MAG: hypothetical protein UU04_C0006G0011 [Candidatus Uhrbacteria bacterium GW2011_GWC2_40_450]KKR89989.1 MAG: hypothetical protein UU40_C0010G0012 [Candidatus Uhrbacteria bacterium GW2011_GWD2_41_121]KKR95898.1 MAG: hypothetical protein UU46_C0011G0005 [Candidatus Uhrbacteria bacterium GW2011_GWD1_41_16]KKR9932
MNNDKEFVANFFTSREEEVPKIVEGLERVASCRSDDEEGYPDNPAFASAREAMRMRLLAESGAPGLAVKDFDRAVKEETVEKPIEQYPSIPEAEFLAFADRYRALSPQERAQLRRSVFESIGFGFDENDGIVDFPPNMGEYVDSLAIDAKTGELIIVTGWAGHNQAKDRLFTKFRSRDGKAGRSYVVGGYIVREIAGWEIPFAEVSCPDDFTDEECLAVGRILAQTRRFLPVDCETFELLV